MPAEIEAYLCKHSDIWSNEQIVKLPLPENWKTIPYGRPLENQAYRVVDDFGRDCPFWVEGELWIGGEGVGKGYRGDEVLTKQKYIMDCFGRWYRTGDNGCFWNDGTIEYRGRRDFQVKVKGHRIELGEIEAILNKIAGVKKSIVCAVEHNNRKNMLVAVVVKESPNINEEFLMQNLKSKLPVYMLPTKIIFEDKLPVGKNAKQDRKEVVRWIKAHEDRNIENEEKLTPCETRMLKIWKRLLGNDNITKTTAPEISAVVYTVIGIVILAVVFIFHYCQYTATYLGTYDESARRRIGLAEKLRTLPLTFFHQRDLADLTSTIMGDCANFEHAFSHTVPQFFGAVISTGIVCIGLLIFNWQMGLALLWVAPISFAIVILSRKCQEKLSKKHMNARLELAEGIQECLETVQDIKACNQEEDYLRKLDAKMDAAEKAQISSEMTTASLLTTGQMFLRLGLATVIVVGNSLVVNGDTSLFTYILFLIAASRLYDPLSGAMANMAELFSVQLQVDRLKEIEEYPEETGEIEIHTNGYDITFDHVRFSYEKDKPVLRDVSFTAKQGQVTALVGPSGGGKSTVAKLAAKFYPLDGGRILLGGTDIAPLNSTMLMKNFSIVFQDVVLFNNTIMENIRVGKKDATDEEVIAAAKAAQCDEFISKLPDGYQTVIGENGSTLSGGECQRLSIARALLKDAPVILLDEATASLDVDNETEIQNAISKLVKGKTVLIIAHRMRTVEAADNIVVLSDGIVVENGTHEELMKENGLYHRLVDLQTASANWKLSV